MPTRVAKVKRIEQGHGEKRDTFWTAGGNVTWESLLGAWLTQKMWRGKYAYPLISNTSNNPPWRNTSVCLVCVPATAGAAAPLKDSETEVRKGWEADLKSQAGHSMSPNSANLLLLASILYPCSLQHCLGWAGKGKMA